jgi:threonine dehydrogenase-like Zn-dependent dehydrogenase
MRVKAIVYKAPREVGVDHFELGPCGPQEVLCETIYSFVSPGTELRNLSEFNKTFPCIPGYSYVGRIIEVGSAAKGWRVGDLISGRNQPSALNPLGIASVYGGHVSHHRCVVSGNCAPVRLPENADPWDYVTAEVASISWHGVSIASPCPGEKAVVIGQGMIGAFAAKWLVGMGLRVVVVDLDEKRLARSAKLGVAGAVAGGAPDVKERILSYFENGADIVVEASSSIAGCQLGASVLKKTLESSVEQSYHLPELQGGACKWPRFVYLATYTNTVETHPSGLAEREGVMVFRPEDRKVGDRQTIGPCAKTQANARRSLSAGCDVRQAKFFIQRRRKAPFPCTELTVRRSMGRQLKGGLLCKRRVGAGLLKTARNPIAANMIPCLEYYMRSGAASVSRDGCDIDAARYRSRA